MTEPPLAKTIVTVTIEIETTYSMNDHRARKIATDFLKEELNLFTMGKLYGIQRISHEMTVKRPEKG